jgi:4-hydroxythreonine-4-phosphate dehydrogenase
VPDQPGQPAHDAAAVVIAAIQLAVDSVKGGECRALVTAPIHKGALYHAGFSHPGHTEFLAALCAEDGVEPLPVMMLAHDELRTVPLTIHVPIRQVPGLLNEALIVETLRVMARGLQSRGSIPMPAKAARSGGKKSRSSARRWKRRGPGASMPLAPCPATHCFSPGTGGNMMRCWRCITTRR